MDMAGMGGWWWHAVFLFLVWTSTLALSDTSGWAQSGIIILSFYLWIYELICHSSSHSGLGTERIGFKFSLSHEARWVTLRWSLLLSPSYLIGFLQGENRRNTMYTITSSLKAGKDKNIIIIIIYILRFLHGMQGNRHKVSGWFPIQVLTGPRPGPCTFTSCPGA